MATAVPHMASRHNGEALRTFRVMRGLSREALAEKTGDLSHQHLSNLELEHKQASPELLHRLAAALDVPVGALLREPMHAPTAVSA